MNGQEFDNWLDVQLTNTKEVLGTKAGEYASKNDRFYNFTEGAKRLGINPTFYAFALAQKHDTCVKDLIMGVTPVTHAALNEKFGDLINYLFLIKAMMHDKINKENDVDYGPDVDDL